MSFVLPFSVQPPSSPPISSTSLPSLPTPIAAPIPLPTVTDRSSASAPCLASTPAVLPPSSSPPPLSSRPSSRRPICLTSTASDPSSSPPQTTEERITSGSPSPPVRSERDPATDEIRRGRERGKASQAPALERPRRRIMDSGCDELSPPSPTRTFKVSSTAPPYRSTSSEIVLPRPEPLFEKGARQRHSPPFSDAVPPLRPPLLLPSHHPTRRTTGLILSPDSRTSERRGSSDTTRGTSLPPSRRLDLPLAI